MQNCSVEYECGMCKIPEAAQVVVLFRGSAGSTVLPQNKTTTQTLKQP